MLQSNDIGVLFASLQASYGHSWAHKADAIPIWYRALGGFNRDEVMHAAEVAIRKYPNFPPTIGQFTEIVEGPKQRANTYLPAPKRPKDLKVANYVLLQVLVAAGGVEKHAVKNLVAMKNALLDDLGEMHDGNVQEMRKQLTELAACSS